MIETPFCKTMSVKELIDELRKFPEDLPVVDCSFNEVEHLGIHVWVDSNYPYNKPDTEVLMIE